uniref:Uncharacterized protein n=1 Tax=Setaria viridis TaxID=4556 RepID=A0A4V6DAZ1_SETVI|nr:hypothetical protein SEVIR_2G144000v2 [Setaria viridis]
MVTAILTLGLGLGLCWWVVLACVEVSCANCDALLERRGRELMKRRAVIGCFSGEGTKRRRWRAEIMGAGMQLGEEKENAAAGGEMEMTRGPYMLDLSHSIVGMPHMQFNSNHKDLGTHMVQLSSLGTDYASCEFGDRDDTSLLV